MSRDALDIRMARLEGAYDQITKRLDDLHGNVGQLRAETQAGLQQLRAEVHTGLQQLRIDLRGQFWQFAALVLPLWLAAAALLFRH